MNQTTEAPARSTLLLRRAEAVGAALAEVGTVAGVAELAIGQGAGALGPPAGLIGLLSNGGEALVLAASQGLPPAVIELMRSQPVTNGVTAQVPTGAVVRNKAPQWFRDNAALAREYPALAAAREPAGLEAAAIIPLIVTDQPLGVIVFAYHQPLAFDAVERAYLHALAHQVSLALERLRLLGVERDLRLHEQQARAEAEAGRERLAFLVEISTVLSVTLDYDRLLQRVAGLLVPYLADYASVYALEPDQRILNIATAHRSPEKQAALRALHAQVQLRLDSPHSLIAQVMRTSQPLLDPAFDWQRQYAQAPRADQEYLAALQPNAHIIMPLVARGRALGVIVLATSEQGRRLGQTDLNLAADVARRVALAADNARLLQQAHRMNVELEQRVQERTSELLRSEARFHSLVDSVQDYAIFLLDPTGHVASWNTGAQRIKGYQAEEILGKHFSVFYTPEDQERGLPARGLGKAREVGHFESEGWRVRQDGTRFWANVVITLVRSPQGEVMGFAKVTRDLTERKALEDELRSSRALLLEEMAARRAVQQQLEQAREAERARIAREVHDELGGALTGLKMGLRRLRRTADLPASLPAQLDELARDIDGTVQIVRRIAHELRPAVLDDFGLLAALEWQLDEFRKRSGLETEWHNEVEALAVSGEAAIACFRIFQEALTNVARHAQATRVVVGVYGEAGRLVVRIADNGQGMPAAAHSGVGHLGLIGMRERAALIGGELTLTSLPDRGTTVLLKIPLPSG